MSTTSLRPHRQSTAQTGLARVEIGPCQVARPFRVPPSFFDPCAAPQKVREFSNIRRDPPRPQRRRPWCELQGNACFKAVVAMPAAFPCRFWMSAQIFCAHIDCLAKFSSVVQTNNRRLLRCAYGYQSIKYARDIVGAGFRWLSAVPMKNVAREEGISRRRKSRYRPQRGDKD